MDYPCGICNLPCPEYRVVGCDHCNKWYHINCENLKVKDFTYLSKTELPYICSQCTVYPTSKHYNYDMALDRLSNAARSGHLVEAAKLESLFMRHESLHVSSPSHAVSFSGLHRDPIANTLLGPDWQQSAPVKVREDGNCLFNAISVAIFGHEHASSELKVKTCIEMTLNESFYVNFHSNTNIPLVSTSFEQAKLDCAINGRYSSCWTIHAASNVIKRPIKSVYPVVNGNVDGYIGILNTTFKPRLTHPRPCRQIVVMWTNCQTSTSQSCNWIPNHFVPLVPSKQVSTEPPILIHDHNEFPPLSPSSSEPSDKLIDNKCDIGTDIISEHAADEADIKLKHTDDGADIQFDHADDVADNQLEQTDDDSNLPASNNIPEPKNSEINNTSVAENNVDITSQSINSDLDITDLSNDVHQPYKNPSENGLNGTFMSVEKLFHIARTQAPKGSAIPQGIKENVYFVINDTPNIQRRSNKKQSEYSDDCGAYDSKKNSTKSHYYILSGPVLTYVEKKNGLFGNFVKKSFVSLEPQPDPTIVVNLKRKYSVLSRNNNYKKRVSWFEGNPKMPVAIVEYIG